MASRQPSLSGWTPADRPTFGEKPGTGSSVDRAIHPTSAKQGRIRKLTVASTFNFVISPEGRLIRPQGSEHDICQILKKCAGVAGN
jgi:hypothetical protein